MASRPTDEFRTLTVDVEGPLCTVTLNDPDNLNTITLEMHDELTKVWPIVASSTRSASRTWTTRAEESGGTGDGRSDQSPMSMTRRDGPASALTLNALHESRSISKNHSPLPPPCPPESTPSTLPTPISR